MTWFYDGDDEEEQKQRRQEEEPGPQAGDYSEAEEMSSREPEKPPL